MVMRFRQTIGALGVISLQWTEMRRTWAELPMDALSEGCMHLLPVTGFWETPIGRILEQTYIPEMGNKIFVHGDEGESGYDTDT